MKRFLRSFYMVEPNIRRNMAVSTWFHLHLPLVGRWIAMFIDRMMLWRYGLDVISYRNRVARLKISHPCGILLGGNGIVSEGRVAIMSGVKFVGISPVDPDYLARHKTGDVFRLGDNVMIGANSTVIGPIEICDNVMIGTMSLVNKSITEPGTYAGIPARQISAEIPSDIWVRD